MAGPACDWDARMGPAIGEANDMHFLKEEPWLEIKSSSLDQCWKDGMIPWIRSGARGALLEAEQKKQPIIIGPNCVFADSNSPNKNDVELQSPVIHRLLMSDYDNMALAQSLSPRPEMFRQVPYFMRPEMYEKPFYYRHEWDVYFHIKTSANKWISKSYLNHTATHHGWYKFAELMYKAQHSAVCVHGCAYDNYGLSVHEISLLGCPIVFDSEGMKGGTIGAMLGKTIGCRVSSIAGCDVKEALDAVQYCMGLDRRKVWEASMDHQSPEKLKERYRKAILE
jgi:hypothetical protein